MWHGSASPAAAADWPSVSYGASHSTGTPLPIKAEPTICAIPFRHAAAIAFALLAASPTFRDNVDDTVPFRACGIDGILHLEGVQAGRLTRNLHVERVAMGPRPTRILGS
jgi:hypothetical protein